MPRAGAPRPPVSIGLARTRCTAGEPVIALVDGAAPPATVALVRIEQRPSVQAFVVVDERELAEPCGVLELALPAGALPTVAGNGCALSYAVRVRARGVVAWAGLEVVAEARPHVARGSCARDPLIAGWDARHFHLELGDALLRGGGRVAGRVHRHGRWCATAIVVHARCDECWRPAGPAARGMPYWNERTLWAAEHEIGVDPDRAWVAFCFRLPQDLPPAVEARTIAWRYELRARRRREHLPDETAALTPLLFDEHMDAP
jgi:hypothetical protein